MGAMGLIGIMIKALAGGTNAAATALTVWSGMDWAAKKGADLKASEEFRKLADMISCENVAGDLDPYDTDVKEYIEGHQNKLDQVILTEEYRKEFLDAFYEAHPQYLVHHEKIDHFLGIYLDRLEAVLQKRITLGDKFILQGQSELKKMDQELMAKQDQSIQIMEELISEWRQFKQRHDSAPVQSPSHPSNLDSLSFYKVRRLTDDLWVNWETGLLGEDFDSVRKMADDTNDNTYVDTDGSTDGDKDANVKDGAENGRRRLSPSQVRLLSVLVQGEGAVVSWKELFWRGKLTDRFLEKYSIDDLSRTVYEYIQSRQEDVSIEDVTADDDLGEDEYGLFDGALDENILGDNTTHESILGEGAEKIREEGRQKHVAEIILEYIVSAIGGSLQSSDKKVDVNLLQQEAFHIFYALRKRNYSFPDNVIQTAAQTAIYDLCEADALLSKIIVPDKNVKGYRIILQEEDEDGSFPDLFEEYEGCTPDKDWSAKDKSVGGKRMRRNHRLYLMMPQPG